MSSSPGTRRPGHTTALVVVAVLLVVGVALAVVTGVGAKFVDSLYPPGAVTDRGAAIRDLYTIVFVIAAAIFLLVEGLIIWSVLRYRRRPEDTELPPQTHGNNIAEALWTIVPTIIVGVLFVLSWQTLNTVDAVSANPDLKVRAVAGQFQWTFDYMPSTYDPKTEDPGNPTQPEFIQFVPVGEDGGLTLPTGRRVQLYIVSQDVIHAFYVPQFLFKRDAIPGRVNQFEFTIDDAYAGSTFRGQCAELCGAGHRIMLFDVNALDGAAFDTWLADKTAGAGSSPPPASASPSAGGSPEPSASGSTPPATGTTVSTAATGIQFTVRELTAPADSPITIDFENQEAVPHNIKIFKGEAGGEVAFEGEIFTGPATRQYLVGPLAAGSYPFICAVHPNMTGTLTVQ